MSYKDKYTALNTARGNSVRESRAIASKQKIGKVFEDSLSFHQVKFNDEISTRGVIITDNSDSTDKKKIIAKPDEALNVGDYVSWDDSTWIVTLVDNVSDIYRRGNMVQCESSLKWLNEDGYVREVYFSYAANVFSGIGIQDGTYMVLPNERRHIYIQKNADSSLIKKSKRFIIDGRAWKVTSIDRLQRGIIYIELEEDLIASGDNLELRIADYAGNFANYAVTINDGNTLTVNTGFTYQLSVAVTNNGNPVSKEVIYSSSDDSVAMVSSTGLITAISDGNVTITAKLEIDRTVQDSISVTVSSVVADNYTLSVAEDPSVFVNSTRTFTAVVKNNGVVVTGRSIQWSLFADDQTSTTTKATITASSDTKCTLKGNSIGYVKLKMVLVGETNVFNFVRIYVDSLI